MDGTAQRFHLVAALALGMASLGATSVQAQQSPIFEDVTATSGFGKLTETWGASWGDVNGDLYPDLFIGNHRNRASLFRNKGDGTFVDASREVDLSRTPGWTGGRADVDTHGATWADVDNDGDDDLYESVSVGDDNLFINDAGKLTNLRDAWNVDELNHYATRQNLFVDFNGDGLLDLASIALRRSAFAPQLPDAQFGDGSDHEIPIGCSSEAQWAHLADVHETPGLELLCAPRNEPYPKSITAFVNGEPVDVTGNFPRRGPVNDAVAFDANGDLRTDLFLLQGAERPSDASQSAPDRLEVQFITAARRSKAIRFKTSGVLTVKASLREGSDPQGYPGYIDIGAGRWSPSTLEFQLDPAHPANHGIGTGSPGFNIGRFPAEGEWRITQGNNEYSYSYIQVQSTEPITDVVFEGASGADKGRRPVFLMQRDDGFQVTTSGVGTINTVLRCQSVVAGDFDNDMDQDLFLACTGGTQNLPDRLFLNDGRGRFTEAPQGGGAAGKTGATVADAAGTGESVVTADYDVDGFLDLMVANGNNMRPLYVGGPLQLFRNRGNDNRWLELDLVGTTSNRDAVGARVYVTAGGVAQYREQNGGYHRWSQNFQRIHVGLGENRKADVRVIWPDGSETEHLEVAANGLYQLTQDGEIERLIGTDPGPDPDPDADGDGLSDEREATLGTDPQLRDTDGDGLDDGPEVDEYGTNPLDKNTDRDGLSDRVEIVFKHTDPVDPDTDDDGLTDGREAAANGLGTDPLDADTDDGGVNDGAEVERGTDPLDPLDD